MFYSFHSEEERMLNQIAMLERELIEIKDDSVKLRSMNAEFEE